MILRGLRELGVAQSFHANFDSLIKSLINNRRSNLRNLVLDINFLFFSFFVCAYYNSSSIEIEKVLARIPNLCNFHRKVPVLSLKLSLRRTSFVSAELNDIF